MLTQPDYTKICSPSFHTSLHMFSHSSLLGHNLTHKEKHKQHTEEFHFSLAVSHYSVGKNKKTQCLHHLYCRVKLSGPSPVAYSAQPQAISTNWGHQHYVCTTDTPTCPEKLSSPSLISTSHSPLLLLELLHPYRISHLPHGFSHLVLSAVPPVVPSHLPSCLLPCRAGHCRPVQTAPPTTP